DRLFESDFDRSLHDAKSDLATNDGSAE
ncbi:MAG: hypothetical protein ACI8ZW_001424, partial [Yoonia sp.]